MAKKGTAKAVNRNHANYSLAFLFLLLFSVALHAERGVKITAILDTNLFRTSDGDTISLANVRTFSLSDPDSLKRFYAVKRILPDISDLLLNRKFLIEIADTTDGVLRVHLFQKLPLTHLSINRRVLANGLGYLDPTPDNRYTSHYKKAAEEAKRKGLGVYDSNSWLPQKYAKTNAFWLSFGKGIGIEKHHHKYGEPLNFDLWLWNVSAFFRKDWLVISGGYQKYYPYEGNAWINSREALLGYAYCNRNRDTIFSIGLSQNKYFYYTESIPAIAHSDYYYGVVLKMQLVNHPFPLAALGTDFKINFSKKFTCYTLSLNLNLGLWR